GAHRQREHPIVPTPAHDHPIADSASTVDVIAQFIVGKLGYVRADRRKALPAEFGFHAVERRVPLPKALIEIYRHFLVILIGTADAGGPPTGGTIGTDHQQAHMLGAAYMVEQTHETRIKARVADRVDHGYQIDGWGH